MKILYTSDVHETSNHWTWLFDAIQAHNPDIVIVGGDICPKDLPSGPPGTFGLNQRSWLEDYLTPMLYGLGKRPKILLDMSNDDAASNRDILLGLYDRKIIGLLHRKICYFHNSGEDFFIMGYMNVPFTPFGLKDWEYVDGPNDIVLDPRRTPKGIISLPNGKCEGFDVQTRPFTIRDELGAVSERFLDLPERGFFVCHTPPYGTQLDILTSGVHVGSLAVRDFIQKNSHRFLATLHGHIHESPHVSGDFYDESLGTLSINPGQERARLHYVMFDTQDVKNTLKWTWTE